MTADPPTLTIARLSRVLENHATSELSMPQYRVLGLLASGHERATELASKLAVTKPTLTVARSTGSSSAATSSARGADGDRRAVRLVITRRRAGRRRPGRHRGFRDGARRRARALRRSRRPCSIALDDLRLALDARWCERAAAALDGGELATVR